MSATSASGWPGCRPRWPVSASRYLRPSSIEAYAAAARWLGGLWQMNRDVSVREYVVALLKAVDAALPGRLSAETMAALISAYASPALMAPPAVDPGARVALETLAAEGARLAVISNTMRTPGEVVRQVLDKAGLLPLFRVLTFSDECGIRKPASGDLPSHAEGSGCAARGSGARGRRRDPRCRGRPGCRDGGDPGDPRRARHGPREAGCRHPAPRRAAGRAAAAPLMAFRLTGPRGRVYLIAAAVIVVVLALFLWAPDFLQAVEVRLYDLHFKLRGTQAQPAERIVIVAIDEKSLAALGRWPWPRSLMARPRPEALGGRRQRHRGRYPAERAGGERRAPGGRAAVGTAPDAGAGRELRRVGGPARARHVRPRGRSRSPSWPRPSGPVAA